MPSIQVRQCDDLRKQMSEMRYFFYCCQDEDVCGCCKDPNTPSDDPKCKKILDAWEKLAEQYEKCMAPVQIEDEEPIVSKLVANIQYPYKPLSDVYIDPYPKISDIEQTRRDSVSNLLVIFANEDDLLKALCEKLNQSWSRPKGGMMLDCSGPPRIPCPECLKTKYGCKDFASCWAAAFRLILKDLEDLGKDCQTNPFGYDGCGDLLFKSLKFQEMLTAPPCSKSSTPKRCYMEQLILKAQTNPTDAIKQLIDLLTILSNHHRGLQALIEFLKSLLGPPVIDQNLLIEILKKLRDAWGEPVPPINPVPPTNPPRTAPPPLGPGLPPPILRPRGE